MDEGRLPSANRELNPDNAKSSMVYRCRQVWDNLNADRPDPCNVTQTIGKMSEKNPKTKFDE